MPPPSNQKPSRARRILLSRWPITIIAAYLLANMLGVPGLFPHWKIGPWGIMTERPYTGMDPVPMPAIAVHLVYQPSKASSAQGWATYGDGATMLWNERNPLPWVYSGTVYRRPAWRLRIPLALPTFVAVALAAFLHGRRFGTRFHDPNLCRRCGYPIQSVMCSASNPESCQCPECGTTNRSISKPNAPASNTPTT